jgi:hypothetical protein
MHVYSPVRREQSERERGICADSLLFKLANLIKLMVGMKMERDLGSEKRHGHPSKE